jgi:mono/diheme cytochrome c family protein
MGNPSTKDAMTTRRCTILSFLLLATACGGADAAPGKPQPPAGGAPSAAKEQAPIALAEAKQMFESLCFTCHGLTGHGDGPGAAALDPKPRSFVDPAWQASVTDEHIKKVIVYGGAAVGKSPMMIAQPQLKGNEAVLNGLVQVVRGFRGK